MKQIILLIIFNTLLTSLNAQFIISGTVENEMGEPLIGASVFLHRSEYAAITNEKGEYLLEDVDQGYYLLKCSHLSYESYTEGFDINDDLEVNLILIRGIYNLENIEITADNLKKDSPFAYSKYNREEIELKNLGQDLPILVGHSPSMVTTSDAGNGIGYTGMRIRGSDPTRINVTVNGVPLNDSESHSVFWVNLPDFGSSLNDIQIQRGVGPSTNGSSAFGGTVALNTNKVFDNPFVSINGGYGSYNSRKVSVSMNTGLINNSFMIEGRYSLINSDGFIDRASSDLKSWYFSAAKINKKSSLRFNAFSGKEVTYQAWNGVPEALLNSSVSLTDHYLNNKGVIYETPADSVNLFNGGRTYNLYTYSNQVDDYTQNHMQLIYTVQASDNLRINATLHQTGGKGFFEEFKFQEELAFYNITDSVDVTNVVRRRWLDNKFYGAILNAELNLSDRWNLFFGGSFNIYDGDHYGEVVATSDSLFSSIPKTYYENNSNKTDLNFYTKANVKINNKLSLFADFQYRSIDYDAFGIDNGNIPIDIFEQYQFFNPKGGINYSMNDSLSFYFSYAVAQKEPVRSDFTDAVGTSLPQAEKLNDFELGMRLTKPNFRFEANSYFMMYKDQLIVTGAINDVGAPVRVNVDDSYRIGLELQGEWYINDKWTFSPNLTLSHNKVKSFDEIIVDYDTNTLITNRFENTDIAFSPSVVAAQKLLYKMNNSFKIGLLSKYVGKQFLDNTSNENRIIDAYLVNDLVFEYKINLEILQDLKIRLLVNNILDYKYSANGYTYSYKFGEVITENFYYPQAGINFLLNVAVKF